MYKKAGIGKFTITEGVSSENPSLPVVPNIGIKLFDVFLPAYTFDKDNVVVTRERHQRYTMKDIGKIDERLDHVEYYTALNLLERDAESFEIIDANGLNRFKSGFVVDNFAGHRVGDTQHVDYKNSIDMENNELRPENKTKVTQLLENVSTDTERTAAGYKRTGHLLTLPYTEETIVEQPFASSVERISAFHTFSWMGDIKLTPSSDEWFEHETAPELVINVDGNFDAVTNAAVNQIGTVWNAWETQWSGVTASSGSFVTDRQGRSVRSIQTIRTDQTRTGVETKVVAQIADKYCDIILVGDSLGMVLYGMKTTRKVKIETMILHAKTVKDFFKEDDQGVQIVSATGLLDQVDDLLYALLDYDRVEGWRDADDFESKEMMKLKEIIQGE